MTNSLRIIIEQYHINNEGVPYTETRMDSRIITGTDNYVEKLMSKMDDIFMECSLNVKDK